MRRMLSLIALVWVAQTSSAETIKLAESFVDKECTRVEIRTKVDGERIYYQEGQPKKQPIKLEGGHRCVEKVLAIHEKTGLPAKVVRNYEAARSSLTIGTEKPNAPQTLRVDRAFIVALRSDEGLTVFSPKGPLYREELELIGEHFDTLVLAGLLPGKEVAVDATWQLANPAVLGLCQFEGLIEHSLTGKLDAVAGDKAKVSITGTAKGIDAGAQVVLSVSAVVTFDTSKSKIVAIEWKQEDQRDQGPLSPGFKANVTINITRAIVDEPSELNEAALATIPAGLEAPGAMTAIAYRDPQNHFGLNHAREWRMTSVDARHTILRLVERGDLVAQATITMLDRAKAGEHMSKEDFEQTMMTSPGWEPGSVIEKGEVNTRPGRYIYRLSASGTIDGKQIVQTFILVANANGEQLVAAFQAEQQKTGKLGSRDLNFIDGLEFSPSR